LIYACCKAVDSDFLDKIVITSVDSVERGDIGQLVLLQRSATFECLNFVAECFRMVTLIILRFLVLNRRILDNSRDVLARIFVHLEEHLLAFAIRWLVVVNKQVAQDPLVQLQPSLQAAAKFAAAFRAATLLLRLFLVRVEGLAVLTLVCTVMAVNIIRDLALGEQESLHRAYCGAKEDRSEDNKRETGGHNDGAVFDVATVDSEDETEGDSTSDETCIANEEDLLPSDARVVAAESQKANEAESASETTHNDNAEHDENKMR